MNSNPIVYVGIPCTGSMDFAAAASLAWLYMRHNTYVQFSCNSMLTDNFNSLLCGARNIKVDDKPFEYFAMQHSDIQPTVEWIDTLIGLMKKNNLSVLSAASPIKDKSNEVSCGVLKEGTHKWSLKRFSYSDLAKLPTVFTSKDVGNTLLINTGLMIWDMSDKRLNDICFRVQNEIKCVDGVWKHYSFSEDWQMSVDLAEKNIPYGCTTAIQLEHVGRKEWKIE